jgi:hypothetical protein
MMIKRDERQGMKRYILVFIIMAFCFEGLVAQSKSQRRIYLWDVTLSMKGYQGRTPDIYGSVVDFLKREIDSLRDESTEIVVLPFQESILERWSVRATEDGKKEIIGKIVQYKNEIPTNTNIVRPIREVQSQYIKADKHNLLFLLTDGKQTGGNSDLLALIRDWEEYAKINDAYALYVMLTEDAMDPEVITEIEKNGSMDVVTKPGNVDFIDLEPARLVKFNIKDDHGKPVVVSLSCKKSIALPEGVKVRVKSDNRSTLHINETTEIKHLTCSFSLDYNYQDLKNSLPENTYIPLKLELLNQQEVKEKTGKIVLLNPTDIGLELINKPEKTLKIRVRKSD